MKILKLALIVLISLLNIEDSRSQDTNSYPLWNDIEDGEYSVGFKVLNHWDKSRNNTFKYDEDGTINKERFFPIQIAVWYPTATEWEAEKAMPFKEYFYLTEQKNDFKIPSEERKKKAMDIFSGFTKFGAKIEHTEEELVEIGNEATAVMQNAESFKEEFPVIIAGHDGGVWKNTTLNEYLASHGYVVISTGLLSQTSSMFSGNPQVALQRRIRTFELIREMLPSFEYVNENKIGLLGMNADGMTALLYQMKNTEADVMVNIDGWDGKNNGYRYVSSSPYFDAQNFNIPLMEFHQHEDMDREPLQLNATIFDSLNSSKKYSYVLTDFGHAYLTGNTIALTKLDSDIVEKYEFMFNSILNFYDHYLKEGKQTGYKKLEKPASFFQRFLEKSE